jgi:hypothetical protein
MVTEPLPMRRIREKPLPLSASKCLAPRRPRYARLLAWSDSLAAPKTSREACMPTPSATAPTSPLRSSAVS